MHVEQYLQESGREPVNGVSQGCHCRIHVFIVASVTKRLVC